MFYLSKKIRYRCSCGKRFAENNSFFPRYHRMTNRLSAYIVDRLRDVTSFSSVAREVNLSVIAVIRIFDFVSYSLKKLPVALSIDEFKGNTNGEKYHWIRQVIWVLKLFANKSKRNSANLIADISRNPDNF